MFSPKTANTNKRVCSLKRDNLSHGDFWILVDESEVRITKQRSGENPDQSIVIPKRVFNKFVDFYLNPTEDES